MKIVIYLPTFTEHTESLGGYFMLTLLIFLGNFAIQKLLTYLYNLHVTKLSVLHSNYTRMIKY